MVEHATSRAVTFVPKIDSVLTAVVGFTLSSLVAAASGGYYSDSWSWLALISFAMATVLLIVRPEIGFGILDWLLVGGLAAFAGWVALSTLWAPSQTAAIRDATRAVAYVGVVLLVLLVVRRQTVQLLLGSVLAGVTVVSSYSLITRLAPDRVGGWNPVDENRLADPIGYWNGLGIYAVMGSLLAVGLAARGKTRSSQFLAGAAPVVLLSTVFFTFSRGSWLALGVGLVVAIVVDPRRLQLIAMLLALAPWPALTIAAAWHSEALTTRASSIPSVAHAGHKLLPIMLALAVVAGLVALAVRELEERIDIPVAARRAFAGVLVLALVVALGALGNREGSPSTIAHRVWTGFDKSGGTGGGQNLTGRLFHLSSNGRVALWRVGWSEFESAPVAGVGAGSFEQAWFRERPFELSVRDGHSLYVETLGELGLVGLGLLLTALVVPLVAAFRTRRMTLLPAAIAPYAAYLAHAGVDWDWELAGVTLVALLAGAALVVRARPGKEHVLRAPLRLALPAVTGVLALLSIGAVLGNVPLERARSAYAAGNFDSAAADARRATRWEPWSATAFDLLGRAQLAEGSTSAARSSFQRAVKRNPRDWEMWRDLAAASPPKTARKPLARAIELNPRGRDLTTLATLLGQG